MRTPLNKLDPDVFGFNYPEIASDPLNARLFALFLLEQVPIDLRPSLVLFLVQALDVADSGDPNRLMDLDENEQAARESWNRAWEKHYPNHARICKELRARTGLEGLGGTIQ